MHKLPGFMHMKDSINVRWFQIIEHKNFYTKPPPLAKAVATKIKEIIVCQKSTNY